MKIVIIGLWHQGVVGAACLASLGYDVIAADHDAQRVAALSSGKASIFEPGLDDLLRKGLDSGLLHFTIDVAGAVRGRRDVLLMFDTPVNDKDESDLSEIFLTAREIAPNLEDDTLLYVTAQVPIGTCDAIATAVLSVNAKAKFGIGYSPENLRLGQAIDRFLHPALPVIGADNQGTLDRMDALLKPLGTRWERVTLRTAEMTKHALNGFLAASITYANELGNLCDEVGADGRRIAEVLRLEPRIGPKAMLFPGLGFSGGTLARDMQTLRGIGAKHALETPMLDGIWTSNGLQNQLVVRKLKRIFGTLKGLRVAVLGLTYKPDTSTLRRSASIEIIGDLVREGAVVCGHDPRADRAELAEYKTFTFNEDVYAMVQGFEALVLITPWADYRKLDYARISKSMARPVLIDTANMLDANQMTSLGFTYADVGRGRG